jgi:hypothetical protein
MTDIKAELINGVALGIEHISFDDEEDTEDTIAPKWAILVHIFIFRVLFIKY